MIAQEGNNLLIFDIYAHNNLGRISISFLGMGLF